MSGANSRGADAGSEAGGRATRPPSATPKGLILGFALVGLFVVVLAAWSSGVIAIPPTAEFGLYELLPWSYWVGMLLMGLSVGLAVRSRSPGFIALTGALFFAILAGTPVLFEPNPSVWDAYHHLRRAQEVGLSGTLPTAPWLYAANWPGLFVFVSFISAVSGIAPLHLISLFPFLTGGLIFLALFVFLRSILPPPLPGLAAVFGSLLNVWAQYHLAPQSVGLILALLVLATVWKKSLGLRTASAILFLGLVVTHPTSTVLLLSILFVDRLLMHVRPRREPATGTPTKAHPAIGQSPALAFGAVWIAWLFFQATGSSQVAETAILTQFTSILQIPEETVGLATTRAVENIYFWAPQIRLASLSIYAVFGLIALILLSRTPRTRRLARFFWAVMIGTIAVAVADILAFQGIFFDRALLFFALLVPAICVGGIGLAGIRKTVRRSLWVVLLVTSVASASTLYYQEAFYFVSDRSMALSQHLQRVEPESLVVGGSIPPAVWIDPAARTEWDRVAFFVLFPESFTGFQGDSYVYAVFDSTGELWHRQWYGLNIYRFYEEESTNYSRVYANGDAAIHLIAAPSSGGL